ncbi:phosphoglycerate mutase family protein [Candidatus Woesearchaeota archaeon]|nr:phosphoglycerate mutase family protein [Candidatus Woesearchaeota archaeon]
MPDSPTFLYLSRHGQTYDNLGIEPGKLDASDPLACKSRNDLTEKGIEQARILAQYAGVYIFDGLRTEECGVISSSDQRSMDTAEEIVRINRISGFNYRKSPLLREETPAEFLSLLPAEAQQYAREHLTLKPKAVLAGQFSSELETYIRLLRCRAIIAPLHGNMNSVFLEHIGVSPILMDNCSILPLKYENGRFAQEGDYITNDQMRIDLEDN